MTAWTVLASCGPGALISAWWIHRISRAWAIAATPTPDNLGVLRATRAQDAALWTRNGHTIRYYPVPGTRLTTPKEPTP